MLWLPCRHRTCPVAVMLCDRASRPSRATAPAAQRCSAPSVVRVGRLASLHPRPQTVKGRLRQVVKRNPFPSRRARKVVPHNAAPLLLGHLRLEVNPIRVKRLPPLERHLRYLGVDPRTLLPGRHKPPLYLLLPGRTIPLPPVNPVGVNHLASVQPLLQASTNRPR